MKPRILLLGLAAGLVAAVVPATAASSSHDSSGHATGRTVGLLRDARPTLGMTQSGNWSGYNKGALESGTTFHSISGQWVVPTATAAKKGQAEASSSWLGIGGGCVDANCIATDQTLIQAGTEQDVDANGKASYSSWYEVIPAPSINTPLAVKPGDTVSVSIAESVPEVWTISMRNVTTGRSWSTTVPYTSTYATAEWIEETPLVIGGGAGFAAMPKLSRVTFDNARVNGGNAALSTAEAMQLVDSSSGKVLATPSAPDAERDGFNDCTYATSCPAP